MDSKIGRRSVDPEYWEKILSEGFRDPDAGKVRILSAAQEDDAPLVRGVRGGDRRQIESSISGNGAQAIEEGVDTRYNEYAEDYGFDYRGTSTPTSFENLVDTIISIVEKENGNLRKITVHPSCEQVADRADSINLVFDNGRVYNISTANLSDYNTSDDDYCGLEKDSRQAFRDRFKKWVERILLLELEEFSDEAF